MTKELDANFSKCVKEHIFESFLKSEIKLEIAINPL